jgi:uncharacterized membrane-anchored protein
LIVAAHLCVVGREQSLEHLASRFDPRSLCVIGVAKSAADVLTDFALDEAKFSRLIIRSGGVSALEARRIVQRVLEVETLNWTPNLGPVVKVCGAGVHPQPDLRLEEAGAR